MHRIHTAPHRRSLAVLALLAAALAGCAGTPPVVEDEGQDTAQDQVVDKQAFAGAKRYTQVLEGLYILDFEVDTHYSSLDKASCYAFLTGTLTNNSSQNLSRRSAVEFHVYHGDALLFRDYTYLRTDLSVGNRVQFILLESPLHKKQCPSYDHIDVVLKKIPLS
ncbi:MAG: hypothetical protein PHR30_06790 [Gallionellaceae bacterium]|nr:hypothetical protein [Gallionellaceae bacterium]